MPPILALSYYAVQGIERPPTSYFAPVQPCYAIQFTARPPASYPRLRAQQTSTPFALKTQRQFSHLGMPLSQALQKLVETGLLTTLTLRPLSQLVLSQFRIDLHCAYHQGSGHETDRYIALRHAIQDMIDQGVVQLRQSSVTTNPLPDHTTHAVPPLADGIHYIDFVELDYHIHMLRWDDSELELIVSYEIYEIGRVTLGLRMSTPFRLVPGAASVQMTTVEPLTFPHYSVQTPFVLSSNVDEVQTPYVDNVHTSDVQYVIRGGRVVRQQPPAAAKPLEGTSAHEKVRRDDDEILRQLRAPRLVFLFGACRHLPTLTETH